MHKFYQKLVLLRMSDKYLITKQLLSLMSRQGKAKVKFCFLNLYLIKVH